MNSTPVTEPVIDAAIRGDLEGLTRLLRTGGDYLAVDSQGYTALHWSVLTKRGDIVEALLVHHLGERTDVVQICEPLHNPTYEQAVRLADRHVPSLITPIELAAKNQDLDLFKILLKHLEQPAKGFQFNSIRSTVAFEAHPLNFWSSTESTSTLRKKIDQWDSPIQLAHLSILTSQSEVLRLFLKLPDFDVDQRCMSSKQTLLHTAAFQRDPKFVHILLHAGADPTLLDDHGRSALQQALGHCFPETALALLEAGSPPNACPNAHLYPSRPGFVIPADASPIMLACGLRGVGGDTTLHLVHKLVEVGADVNASSRRGETALHIALTSSSLDVIRFLIASNANVDAVDAAQKTVYHWFALRRLNFGKSKGVSHPDLTNILQLLLSNQGLRPPQVQYNGQSHPLAVALNACEWLAFQVLIEHGFSFSHPFIDAGPNVEGGLCRHPDAIRLLLEGPNYVASQLTSNAAHQAFRFEQLGLEREIVPEEDVDAVVATMRLLAEAGALKAANLTKSLRSPASSHSATIVRTLVELGADIFGVSPDDQMDGLTAAAVCNKPVVLDVLLESRDEQHPPPPDHWIVTFDMLVDKFPSNIDKALHAMRLHGVDHTKDKKRMRVIWGSYIEDIRRGNIAAVNRVIKYLIDVDYPFFGKTTALGYAASAGQMEVVDFLLGAGALPGAGADCTVWGSPAQALHLAVMDGHVEVVEKLVRAGADVNGRSNPTPLDIALARRVSSSVDEVPFSSNRLSVARFLVDHGGKLSQKTISLKWEDVQRFKGYETLWDDLKLGRFLPTEAPYVEKGE